MVIVDLPEGGESRYVGAGSLAPCWFYAQFTGERSGSFAGPAGFTLSEDNLLTFNFPSMEYFQALDPFEFPLWTASYTVDRNVPIPENPLPQPGVVVPVKGASLALPPEFYGYDPEFVVPLDCGNCGGTITMAADSTDAQLSSIENTVTLTRPERPGDPEGFEPEVELEVRFSALEGRLVSPGPFNSCAIQYDP